jgi:hypothetical protein
VEAIMSAVPLRDSRFERTAFEREISDIHYFLLVTYASSFLRYRATMPPPN